VVCACRWCAFPRSTTQSSRAWSLTPSRWPLRRFVSVCGRRTHRWAAVHVLDAARLYRLALEKGSAGARYHAIAEEGVPLREIAEAIGRGLSVTVVSKSAEEAAAILAGWLPS